MSKIELLAKIELLNKYEAMMEEMKSQADAIRNEIKAEMDAHDLEEMIAGLIPLLLSVSCRKFTRLTPNRFSAAAFPSVCKHNGRAIRPAARRRKENGLWLFQV